MAFRFPSVKRTTILIFVIGLVLLGILVSAALYFSPSRKPAVPAELRGAAEVAGFSGIRYTLEEESKVLLDVIKSESGIEGTDNKKPLFVRSGNGKYRPVNLLALSSGADGGAFGAGFLNGWTVAGNRPQFDIVSGTSAGALISPFAFLGAKYDDDLKSIFTNSSPRKIFAWRNIVASLLDDAVADTSPLIETIKRYITRDVVNEIAGEYERGRLLVVTTTNLDSRHTVLWNMTKIASLAANGNSGAVDLFRKVLLASASIPGIFPPVMFDVEAGGKRYHEMHADGAIMSQFVVDPSWLADTGVDRLPDIIRERRLYLIRNTRREPLVMDVSRNTVDILIRSMKILVYSQGIVDLYRIYMSAKQHGVDYNLAHVPESFDLPHKEYFDQEFMRKLYAVGFSEARNGYRWKKHPWLYGGVSADGFKSDSLNQSSGYQ
ncbi:MAG: patatin-like phospholipase family protein [Pseudomonadota bacterium]|jgi:predicted patatin/cPLA2 family phospholipase